MRLLLHPPPEVGHAGAQLGVDQLGEVGGEAAAGRLLVDELLLLQGEDLLGEGLEQMQRPRLNSGNKM